jgi:O-antigen/teichoic acid export membrane protein
MKANRHSNPPLTHQRQFQPTAVLMPTLDSSAQMMAERSIERLASNLGGRYIVTLTGESVQSAYHFILNIILIRVFAPHEYGLFSIGFMIGVAANVYSSALFAIPATIYLPRKCGSSARVLDVTLGSMALAMCMVLSVVVGIGTWLWLGNLIGGFFAGGFVGLWALRNHIRAVVLVRRDTNGALSATLSDICYATTGAGLLVVISLVARIPLTAGSVFGCLCAANAMAILLWLRTQHSRIRVNLGARTFKRYGKLWPEVSWSLAGAVTTTIQGQCQMLLVAGFAGPAAFAPIAAGFVLISPIRILSGTMLNVLRPDLSRRSALGDLQSVRKMMLFTDGVLLLFCLAYGLFLWLAWPLLGDHLYARSFAAEPMGFIVGIAWLTGTTCCIYQPLLALGQVRSRFRDTTLATLVGGTAGCAAIWLLLLSFGPAVSTVGVFTGEAVTLFLLWMVKRRAQ